MSGIEPGEHARTESPWYRQVWDSDGFRRVLRTFGIAFLGLLIPGVLGWLNALTEWARSEGQAPLPDAGSLAYLGVAGIAAGFIAVLNGIIVGAEDATGKGILRSVPARPGPGDRGAASTHGIAVAALVIAVLALLILLL